MWRILRELTYKGGASGIPLRWQGYSDAEAEVSDVNMGDVPLDPIPKGLVGGCRVKSMIESCKDMGFLCLLVGLAYLSPNSEHLQEDWGKMAAEVVTSYRKKTNERDGNKAMRVIPTRAIYAEHFKSLESSGVIVRAKHAPRFCSTYFAVIKRRPAGDDLGCTRAIFNGHRLSKLGRTPPPVNLPGLLDFGPAITDFLNANENVYAYGGDLRHWFHQLPMPAFWEPYFGLSLGSNYTWRSLPMGWAHSPFVAQCAALAILACRLETDQPIFDEDVLRSSQSGPPKILRITAQEGDATKLVGIAMVYYDNFIVLTNDADLHRRTKRRIEGNLARFNAQVKEGSVFCGIVDQEGFEFLGCRFAKRGGRATGRPEKMKQWNETASVLTGASISLHEAATLAGRLLFIDLLSPAASVSAETRSVLRRLGRVGAERGWSHGPLNDQSLGRDVLDCWTTRSVLYHAPFVYESRPEKTGLPIVVCTDASSTGEGLIGYDEKGRRIEMTRQVYVGRQKTWHIFMKELSAALHGVQWCMNRPEWGERRFRLVTDNSGVAFVLRHTFCTNPTADEMLAPYRAMLKDIEISLVISEDNPADVPSRPKKPDGKEEDELLVREKNLWTALDFEDRGGQWASKRPSEVIINDEETFQFLRHGTCMPDG